VCFQKNCHLDIAARTPCVDMAPNAWRPSTGKHAHLVPVGDKVHTFIAAVWQGSGAVVGLTVEDDHTSINQRKRRDCGLRFRTLFCSVSRLGFCNKYGQESFWRESCATVCTCSTLRKTYKGFQLMQLSPPSLVLTPLSTTILSVRFFLPPSTSEWLHCSMIRIEQQLEEGTMFRW
jgi:hypothetical protein